MAETLTRELLEALLKKLTEQEAEEDPAGSPAYTALKKQAAREARRTGEDTLGAYAALTGGRPSSAAVSAAAQAGNAARARVQDLLPELLKAAQEKAASARGEARSTLTALSAQDEKGYSRALDAAQLSGDFTPLTGWGWTRAQASAARVLWKNRNKIK